MANLLSHRRDQVPVHTAQSGDRALGFISANEAKLEIETLWGFRIGDRLCNVENVCLLDGVIRLLDHDPDGIVNMVLFV